MTRTFLWGVLLSTTVTAIGGCSGGDDGDGGPKKTELPGLEPADVDQDGAASDTDCNDGNAGIFPGASETCNGLDDDCNGTVDDDLVQTFYRDADGDTYGDVDETASACAQPAGYVTNANDCDDASRLVQPGGVEVCDLAGVDEDCNGLANEADAGVADMRTWFVDADEDGFGSDTTVDACFEAPGLATVADDCNDADYDMNPGTPEVCDALDKDEDCDGFSDVDDPEGPLGQPLYYVDVDGDDDGDMSDPGQYFCDGVPPGFSTLGTDCDDADHVINPRAPEHCRDLVDNDCNGAVDDCGPIPDVLLDSADTVLEGSALSYNGWSVSSVGDVNGDDQADFATGGWYYDAGKGAVWLYYGPMASGTFEPDDVADAILEGSDMYGDFGWVVDSAGDVNADGFDDVLVGQQFYNGGAGRLFLGPILGDMSASAAEGEWTGESNNDYAGKMVAGDFDFDGDGYDDYLVGADQADYYVGAGYLIYGPGTGTNSLADAAAKFVGTNTYDFAGQEGTGIPDMDGDGLDEIAFGVYQGGSYYGAAYIYFGGSLGGEYELATTADTTITGATSYENLGMRTSRAADFNADGLGDLLIGAPQADTGTYSTGSVYVILGPADTSGSAGTLAHAELYGEYSGESIGQYPIDGSMDVNRDGFSDVVMGAPYASLAGIAGVYNSGTTYVMYGPQTGDVSVANARVAIHGITSYEQSGYAVSFIGDQSGDDSPEVLIGAPFASGSSGNNYVVWGDWL
jgi:hypothetical protein